MSSKPAIKVENLHRRFGDILAVNGVSFEVGTGEVVGFIGENGAGKTTTMRILASLDYPSAGSAYVMGENVVNFPARVRSCLGWMPDSYGAYDNMTVVEYLDFFGRAIGFKTKERLQRIEEVMDFTDLTPLAERLINKLSKGMGQRLCLGRALIHDPDVLILDEPAAGLDPKARVELKHLIRLLADDGKTILISSHILSELGEMCDSLLFINQGRIVHHGDAESLKRQSGETAIYTVEIAADTDAQQLNDWVAMAPMVKILDMRKSGARIEIERDEEEIIAGILRRMVTEGLPIVEFRREERNLEDAFIDMLGNADAPKNMPSGGSN
ncbi:MAG: ABC transporter ATP-binding protein [Verrucomicrobiota bacterium]